MTKAQATTILKDIGTMLAECPEPYAPQDCNGFRMVIDVSAVGDVRVDTTVRQTMMFNRRM